MSKLSKSQKEGNQEPVYKQKERERAARLLKLRHQCDEFNDNARVFREVCVNSDTNSLLLVKSVKYGTIVGRSISQGGMHQLLVLWDGSSVAVPEMPYLLTEDW